jgi:hypothetical protein
VHTCNTKKCETVSSEAAAMNPSMNHGHLA